MSDIDGRDATYRAMYRKAIEFSFQALGSQVSNVVVNYLARKYTLTLGETFLNPASLCEALEGTLGAGALLIERRIVKSIYLQLSSPLNNSEMKLTSREDFERYIVASQALFRTVHG